MPCYLYSFPINIYTAATQIRFDLNASFPNLISYGAAYNFFLCQVLLLPHHLSLNRRHKTCAFSRFLRKPKVIHPSLSLWPVLVITRKFHLPWRLGPDLRNAKGAPSYGSLRRPLKNVKKYNCKKILCIKFILYSIFFFIKKLTLV